MNADDREIVEDGFGGRWVKHGPDCDLQVVRPGKVQCSCEDPRPETMMQAVDFDDSAKRPTPPDDTEGLREQLAKALWARVTAAVLPEPRPLPDGAIGHFVGVTQYDLADTALAVLVEPPGDLRAQMREAARRAFADRVDAEGSLSLSTQRNPWVALDDALAAVAGVRDEHLASLAAQVAGLRDENQRLTDELERSTGRLDDLWAEHDDLTAENRQQREVIAKAEAQAAALQREVAFWEAGEYQAELVTARAERDAAVAAVRTAQITHIRKAHPDRMHDANCLACHVLVPLSAALPSRPDDPEEIRRRAQATTESTEEASNG